MAREHLTCDARLLAVGAEHPIEVFAESKAAADACDTFAKASVTADERTAPRAARIVELCFSLVGRMVAIGTRSCRFDGDAPCQTASYDEHVRERLFSPGNRLVVVVLLVESAEEGCASKSRPPHGSEQSDANHGANSANRVCHVVDAFRRGRQGFVCGRRGVVCCIRHARPMISNAGITD